MSKFIKKDNYKAINDDDHQSPTSPVKLHKSWLKVITGSALVASGMLAVGAFNNLVSADAQAQPTNQQPTSLSETPQGNQNQVDHDQATVDQAQKDAANATPDNIKKTQDEINQTGNDVKKDQSRVDNDQQAESNAQAAVEKAQKHTENTQHDQNQAQSDVNNDQNQLNHDTDGANQAQNAVDNNEQNTKDAQQKQNQAEQQKSDAQDNLNNLDKWQAATKKKHDEAEKNAANDQNAIHQTNQDINNAQDRVNNDNKSINDAQSQLNDLNQSKPAFEQNIHIPAGMTLQGFQQWKKQHPNENAADWFHQFDKAAMANNHYQPSDIAKQDEVIVGTNNTGQTIPQFTNSQYSDMEEYINWLINQMHHQFGTADVEIGGWGMQQFINDLLNGYNQDGWNVGKNGYDVNAINNAAAGSGLLTYPGRNGYETVASGYMNFTNFTTMDAIYSRLYSMIMNLTFNESNSSDSYEMSLLGIDPATGNVNNSKYMGIGIDNYGQIHLVFVNPAQIQNAKQFNEVTAHIPTPATLQRQIDDTYELISDYHKDLSYDSQTLQNAHDKLAALQNQLANDVKATKENNPAQWSADINKAKAEINDLNHQISNQQQIIDNNNAVLPGLQHKLAQAKQQVENDTNQLNNDQSKLQKATAANQQAKDDLARAIQDLINKQNELNRAEQQLQADQAKLIALQKQLID